MGKRRKPNWSQNPPVQKYNNESPEEIMTRFLDFIGRFTTYVTYEDFDLSTMFRFVGKYSPIEPFVREVMKYAPK